MGAVTAPEASTSPPTEKFVRDFAARFTGAWNSCVPERVLELMDPEIVYDDSGWPTLMHEHEEVRPFLTATAG